MRSFDGDRARTLVEAQCALGPRPTGSAASARCAELIRTALAGSGWPVEEDTFTYRGVRCRNLLARAGSTSPTLLLGAHYDTRPRADRERWWWRRRRGIVGANDGASGVAVLIELASVLAPPPPDLWLAFFDAEDRGRLDGWPFCVGSARMASVLQPLPAAVVVADMVGGRSARFHIEKTSTPPLVATIWQLAAELGFGESFVSEPRHAVWDDHTAFGQRGVPAATIIDLDDPHWHRVSDRVEHISADTLHSVGRVLEELARTGAWRTNVCARPQG